MGLVLRLKTILIIFGCLGYTVGHAVFKTYIPNGEGVLNPFCKCGVGPHRNRYSTYSTWERVGHLFPNGEYSHALNPFGMDFKLNGFKWNLTLCEKDSDGDGDSNGYELGDQYCQWDPYDRLTDRYLTAPRSHPGVFGY